MSSSVSDAGGKISSGGGVSKTAGASDEVDEDGAAM